MSCLYETVPRASSSKYLHRSTLPLSAPHLFSIPLSPPPSWCFCICQLALGAFDLPALAAECKGPRSIPNPSFRQTMLMTVCKRNSELRSKHSLELWLKSPAILLLDTARIFILTYLRGPQKEFRNERSFTDAGLVSLQQHKASFWGGVLSGMYV